MSLHNLIYGLLHLRLSDLRPDGSIVTNSQAVNLPKTEEYLIPDLLVCPIAALRDHHAELPPDGVLLVAEITSRRNAHRDRTDKRDAFAASAVPLYLLVDRYDGTGHATLFARPADGVYEEMHRVPFGGVLRLPAPFDGDLDTGAFPRLDEGPSA